MVLLALIFSLLPWFLLQLISGVLGFLSSIFIELKLYVQCTVGWSCYKFRRCNIVLIHHMWSSELVPFSVDCSISTIDLEWWRINLETSRLKYKVNCVCFTCWSSWSLLTTWKSIFHLFLYFPLKWYGGFYYFIFGWCGMERERDVYLEDQLATLHYTCIHGKYSPLIHERLYIKTLNILSPTLRGLFLFGASITITTRIL